MARRSDVFDILVVCTANICRSPLTEHLLRDALDKAAGCRTFRVSSAGINGWPSAEMDGPMATELRRLGGDPGQFRSRPLRASYCDQADLILTATTEHRAFLLQLSPGALRRAFTLLEFAHLVTDVPEVAAAVGDPEMLVRRAAAARSSASIDGYDVPDPYGRDVQHRREVADLIAAAVRQTAVALTNRPVQAGV